MHKTLSEACEAAKKIREISYAVEHRIMIAAPFTALSSLVPILEGSSVELAAQNMGPAVAGAYTGEVSPIMLQDIGVQAVILGHSERREYFAETDAMLQKKIALALEHNMNVTLCVGENLECRNAHNEYSFVKSQLELLQGLSLDALSGLSIAYEPIWAIGTGLTAKAEDVNKMHAAIRQYISEYFSPEDAENMHIQYGGSVKPNNIAELMEQADVDGALVGGASLDVADFEKIICFDQNRS